jgi:outer membrane protein assembly factor BamB
MEASRAFRLPMCCNTMIPVPCKRRWFALALLLAAASRLSAQEPPAVRKVVLPSLDSQVGARMTALAARHNPVRTPTQAAAMIGHLAAGSAPTAAFAPMLGDRRSHDVWEQLTDDYHRMTNESGDTLVNLSDAAGLGVGWTSAQVRRLCHQRLARLPRATLAIYRQRIDPEAMALLAQGRSTRSPAPLRQLVDDLFCSSVGDQALDLLGDLAFERGEFEEARHWWSLIGPFDPDRDDLLRFPDSRIDPARTAAKQILATMFQGRLDEAKIQLTAFQGRHPGAKGTLAGQDDVYHKILGQTLAALGEKQVGNIEEPWTTFGGEATRNRTLSQMPFSTLWEDGPTWRVKLPALEAKDSIPDPLSPLRNLAFHPVISNLQVLIADHRSVASYHLKTGKELFRYDLKKAGHRDPGPVAKKVRLPRYTLSVDERRAYVRLGRQMIGPADAERSDASYLVCLDLTRPEQDRPRELWHVKASADDKNPAIFEGAPLARDGRVYIALTRIVGLRSITSIVCYDTLGRQRWSREVSDTPEFEDSDHEPRSRHHLLSWADGQIVYCSHAGAIVAVDAWTGQPTWGVRYPSRGPLTATLETSPRDLAPCLGADGRVFAAPLDSDRLFCLDANTGSISWELEGHEIVHLLGAAQGRVFATTRNGAIAVDAATGQIAWTQPTDGRLPPMGRGLLAGSWLLWPTQDLQLPFRAVTLSAGRQRRDDARSMLPEPEYFEPSMMHALPVGNVAFGHGCLVIAGQSELFVYVPLNRMQIGPLEPRPHARIDTLYHQARFHASAGEGAKAIQYYLDLLEATRTDAHAKAWRTLIEGRIKVLRGEVKAPFDATIQYKGTAKALPTGVERRPTREMPGLPLMRAWSHDDGRVWPTEANGELVFCSRPGEFSGRAVKDGELRWRQTLDFEPAWVERWRDLVVVAGGDTASALHIKNGETAWTFRAPSRRLRVGSVVAGKPILSDAVNGFVRFEQWDDTLLLLDDDRQFYRIRLDTGEIVWQHASPSARLRPLGVGFNPYFAQVAGQLLAQDVKGQAHWLGQKPLPMGEPTRPWVQAPIVIGKRLILATQPGRIDGHDIASPHTRLWRYEAPFSTSLSGELCRLVHKDSVLLALVPRNEGNDLIRLDPERGTLLWSVPARHLPERLRPEAICIGDTSYFYIHEGVLHSRSLNDGASQWTFALGSFSKRNGKQVAWSLRYTKHTLAVYPKGKQSDQAFFVGFVDPWDGRWLQRLEFAETLEGSVVWTPDRVVVSCAGRIHGFRSLDLE